MEILTFPVYIVPSTAIKCKNTNTAKELLVASRQTLCADIARSVGTIMGSAYMIKTHSLGPS